jgi:COX assembly protein 1
MAAMAPPPQKEEDVPVLPMPSRNPLPLSSGQEAQVREVYHARVRAYCAAEIKGGLPDRWVPDIMLNIL